jgi:hypothetical protein
MKGIFMLEPVKERHILSQLSLFKNGYIWKDKEHVMCEVLLHYLNRFKQREEYFEYEWHPIKGNTFIVFLRLPNSYKYFTDKELYILCIYLYRMQTTIEYYFGSYIDEVADKSVVEGMEQKLKHERDSFYVYRKMELMY